MMEDYDRVLTDMQRVSCKWSVEGGRLEKKVKDLTSVIGMQNVEAQKQSVIGRNIILVVIR